MVVIAERWFQLGNRLFTMGHFIGAAQEYGFRIANPAFADYADYFQTTGADIWCRYPARPSGFLMFRRFLPWLERPSKFVTRMIYNYHLSTRLLRSVSVGLYDEYSLNSPHFLDWTHQNLILLAHGWTFRDNVSFNKHAQIIRDYFVPVPALIERVNKVENKGRENTDILVGIHIRHGDYQQHLNGKYFYTAEQYALFMGQIQSLFPRKKVKFLICSNAEQPSEKFDNYFWIWGDGHLVVDMYSFARCDYLVGPPSTFTQWASFYGQVPLLIIRTPEQKIVLNDFQIFQAGMPHS